MIVVGWTDGKTVYVSCGFVKLADAKEHALAQAKATGYNASVVTIVSATDKLSRVECTVTPNDE